MQLTDHISLLKGKHAFKFGGELLNNQSTSNVTANAKGPITFDGLQDFFAGFPDGPPAGFGNCTAAFEPNGTKPAKGSCLRQHRYGHDSHRQSRPALYL